MAQGTGSRRACFFLLILLCLKETRILLLLPLSGSSAWLHVERPDREIPNQFFLTFLLSVFFLYSLNNVIPGLGLITTIETHERFNHPSSD
ncbi:hypothetical protein QBC43DRAFT_310595 [Cladorrhinum sp. PSN259]|nr:hypothetical protein QBC43DRAFT_310595 [Cladorrhinum sp. PSN259]